MQAQATKVPCPFCPAFLNAEVRRLPRGAGGVIKIQNPCPSCGKTLDEEQIIKARLGIWLGQQFTAGGSLKSF